jgi:hypothetical protein
MPRRPGATWHHALPMTGRDNSAGYGNGKELESKEKAEQMVTLSWRVGCDNQTSNRAIVWHSPGR